jgi:hypothetical protein
MNIKQQSRSHAVMPTIPAAPRAAPSYLFYHIRPKKSTAFLKCFFHAMCASFSLISLAFPIFFCYNDFATQLHIVQL